MIPHPMEVRTTRTVHGDGSVSERRTVYCSKRSRALTVAECSTCDDCRGVTAIGPRQQPALLCASSWVDSQPPARKPISASALHVPIREAINPSLLGVSADASLEQVIELLGHHGIGGVPVLDPQNRPVGMIGERELLDCNRDSTFEGVRTAEGLTPTEVTRGVARDWMAPLPCVIYEGTPIGEVAALMAYEGVHRLPVVDADGTAVGIVTSLDLLCWLAHEIGYAVPFRIPVERRVARAP
jgi:CBS domain-containing protein